MDNDVRLFGISPETTSPSIHSGTIKIAQCSVTNGNKIVLLLIFSLLVLIFPLVSFAHPGRTAADGCHYCRTRCDYWGVPWNQRHCHGGYLPPVIRTTPTIKPTIRPTIRPSTPAPTKAPTGSPQVLSESQSSNEDSLLFYTALAGLGVISYLLYKGLSKK